LEGGIQSCYLDFSDEYAECEEELEDLISDGMAISGAPITATNNPVYLHNVSPFMSPSMNRWTPSKNKSSSTPGERGNPSSYGTTSIAMQAAYKKHLSLDI
jgi:hypothetical protein